MNQVRALAYQINFVLETACNPSFLRNQYHEALYQYHVLGDNIPEPDLHPCFKGEFFPTIRRINSSPLGLSKLSVKEIYRFLIEEITMIDDDSGSQTLQPLSKSRTEQSTQPMGKNLVFVKTVYACPKPLYFPLQTLAQNPPNS